MSRQEENRQFLKQEMQLRKWRCNCVCVVWRAEMRYLAYRQTGRVTLPSEVYTHTYIYIYKHNTHIPSFIHTQV